MAAFVSPGPACGGGGSDSGTPTSPGKRRRSWFTPGKQPVMIELAVEPPSPEAKPILEEEVETLVLTHFTCPPKIDFGELRPGASVTRYLRLRNPHDYEQEVVVDRFPTKKNFTISDTQVTVEGESEVLVTIHWNPSESGNYREVALFKVDGVIRLQATLMGRVIEPPKPKKVRKTWAMKPKIAPRILKPSNKSNAQQQQPAPTKEAAPKLTRVEPTLTKKPEPRVKNASQRPLRNKQNLMMDTVPVQKAMEKDTVSIFQGLQQPRSALPAEFAPVDSPSHTRRSTFEKTSPGHPNTPTITTPPEHSRHVLRQPRRLIPSKETSPLSSVKENDPPLLFCEDENTPASFKAKSKMRRSNTYSKMDQSQDSSQLLESPSDSPQLSDQNDTVLEYTQTTGTTEVTEIVTTTVTEEEVIESEEMIEYLVTDSPNSGHTVTEVNRTHNVLGRHLFTAQQTDTALSVHHLDVFDATRVISSRDSEISHTDGRPSGMAPSTTFATFVKSPGKDISVLSETHCINQSQAMYPAGPLSETYRVSNAHDAYPHVHTQNLQHEEVHRPSPRRFFSSLLSMHEENSSSDNSLEAQDNVEPKFAKQPAPDARRVSSLTVTKEAPVIARVQCDEVDFISKRELFSGVPGSPAPAPDPRRFSTLTVTKQQPTTNKLLQKSPAKTIAKNILPPQTPPRSFGQENSDSSRPSRQHLSPRSDRRDLWDSLSARPLPRTPSPVSRKSPYGDGNMSPSGSGSSPHRIKIYGVNYPGSRSPRQMPVEEYGWSPTSSPQRPKPTPKREKTRRRSSGQFRRRSSPQKAHGYLVARGMVNDEMDEEEKDMENDKLSPTDDPLTLTELLLGEPTMEKATAEVAAHISAPLPLPLPLPREMSRKATRENKVTKAAAVKKPVPKLASLPNYLRPTSATNRRRDAVSESKKRDQSDERQVGMKNNPRTKPEPAAKRVKAEAAPKSVLTGLTKTQLLRRQAALSGTNKENKSATAAKKAAKPKGRAATIIPGVAKSKLQLIKVTAKTALPKHPMAFAAKNVYYDERWKQKQERGFVRWLNFVLTPHEEEYCEALKPKKIDAGTLCLNSSILRRPLTEDKLAPSRETLSFRVYSARRRLNRLRRKACKLFTSDTMVHFHKKLEIEVECARILIRPDRKIYADVGIKQKILDLLLSYNPLWLRIGLEAVYGEVLPLTSNFDALGLSRFILTRVLANPDIAAEFAHPSVPHLYREGYDKALAQFSLKKFLLLVVFLDMAKTSRLIDHDPCLFCKDSEHKASRDLLLVFARDYLSGEGDLCKHVSYIGYTVKHSQTALDELDYAVTNLATDLRDGTRLTRLLGLLSENWALTNKLRVPAISRLQKIHNTDVAFRTMLGMGLDLSTVKGGKIDSRDVVDGHMEKTHQLLWQIIFNFQVGLVLDEKQLEQEIKFLRANLIVKDKMAAILRDDIEALGIPESRRESTGTDMYFKSPKLSLLLKWCRAVCAFYNVKVENFTVSFSDGRVLCYLIHHYHPRLLRAEEIQCETTQTVGPGEHNDSINSESGDDSFTGGYWSNSFSPSTGKSSVWDGLLVNERENYRVLHERVRELGDIPDMIWGSDMSNTIPDEKVVITYVTYLCARLLDIRQEARAARIIQAAWRKYRLQGQEHNLEKRYWAACTIQTAVRKFLAQRREVRKYAATLKLQAAYRGMKARRLVTKMRALCLLAAKEHSVTKIQALVRSWLVRCRLYRQQAAATSIQAWWRMEQVQRAFLMQKTAACIIEEHYMAYRLGLQQRAEFLHKRSAALSIQAMWRACLCRRHYTRLQTACLVIQHRFRAHRLCREQASIYQAQKQAVVTLQAAWRGHKARQTLAQEKQAAVCIQKYTRRMLAQREAGARSRAIVCIQQWYRACRLGEKDRNEFFVKLGALITIQAFYRGWKVRRWSNALRAMNRAAVTIQSAVRGHLARKRLSEKEEAAVVIQRYFRAWSSGKKQFCSYHIIRGACLILQSNFRASIQRRKYLRMRNSAITIQKCYKSHAQRNVFLQQKNAAIVLQRYYRARKCGEQEREDYLQKRQGAVTIQRAFRAHKTHIDYLDTRSKVIHLQSLVRGYLSRKELRLKHSAATALQATVRSYFLRKKFLRLRRATMTLQNAYRARLDMRRDRRQFLITKGAAMTIQAAMRAYFTRKRLHMMNHSATLIQSAFRGYIARRNFSRQVAAANVIQRAFRAHRTHIDYLDTRRKVIHLQSLVRGYLSRKELRLKQDAATMIQSTVQAYLQRKQFLRTKAAVLVLQTRSRAYLSQKNERQSYLKQKSAAIQIQAWFRGVRARQDIEKQHSAAIALQATVRSYFLRKKFLRLRRATVTLQNAYRARLDMRRDRRQFLITKGAAMTIQAAMRAYFTRKRLHVMNYSATLIQSAFRSYITRRNFSRQVAAANVIQKYHRALLLQRRERRKFLITKGATITIQAAFRLYLVRKRLRRQTNAAIVIQSGFRGYRAKKAFVDLRIAACKIQNHLRATLLMRQERRRFLIRKGAAMTIQSALRSYLVRKELQKKRQAATCIQSIYRKHRAQREFQRKREAVCVIQTRYRATLTLRQVRNDFLRQKSSAILLQSVVRSYFTRKIYKKQRRAAVAIQSMYRQHQLRLKFTQMKTSVCIIQRWYRSVLAMKQEQENFLLKKHSAIRIQSTWRSYSARKTLATQHYSATLIQSTFRQYLCRRHFTKKIASICKIQSWYRAILVRNQERRSYVRKIEACVVVQSAVRSYFVRKEITRQSHAATKIQSVFRMFKARNTYIKTRHAACTIQTYHRALITGREQRRCFLIQKGAAMTIQATVRGFLVRRNIAHRHQSASVIQNCYRSYVTRQHFLRLKTSVTIIQSHIRAHLLRKEKRREFVIQKRATITIQSAVRGHLARKRLIEQKDATLKIQCAFRSFLARRTLIRLQRKACQAVEEQRAAISIQSTFRCYILRKNFMKLRSATITLQMHTRAMLLVRHQRREFLKLRAAAVTIQAAWKAHIARQEIAEQHMAATVVQSVFRGYLARKQYQRRRRAVYKIQSHVRACILTKHHRRRYLIQKGAAVTIQAFVRSYFVRRDIEEWHRAATAIQAVYRGYVERIRYRGVCTAALTIQSHVRSYLQAKHERRQFLRLRQAAITIQAAWRGYTARLDVGEQHVAATVVQSVFRKYIARKTFIQQRRAACLIQTHFRAYTLTQQLRRKYLIQKGAAMTIQAFVRSYLVRRDIEEKHRAATAIQAMYRSYRVRQVHVRRCRAVRVLQRYYRSYRTVKQHRQVLTVQKQSACKIQSVIRGFLVRRRIQREQRAVTKIQSVYRAYRIRKVYRRRREVAVHRTRAVTLIQRYYRSYRDRKLEKLRVERRQVYIQKAVSVTRRHLSVIRIQRCFRRFQSYKKAQAQVESVIKIQRWLRCRLVRLRYCRLVASVVRVQRAARAYIAKRHERLIKVQAVVRGWLARRRIQRIHSGISKMQALWRGYIVRKKVRSAKVKAARRRVQAASAAVTEDKKLGNITTSALDFLLRYTQLSAILDALMKLDVATRWSPACCVQMAGSNATHVIFTLIRSCNRSLPHMEVIKYSINVLLNLTKYEKTSWCVFEQEESVDTLVNLLSIFRDKGAVFTKTCTLLGLLSYPPVRREKVIRMPKIVSKIQSLYALTSRKYAMEEKRNLAKAKMAASKSLSCSILSTTLSSRPAVPKIQPEWVLRRHSIREFSDPLQSMKFLLNCLCINPK